MWATLSDSVAFGSATLPMTHPTTKATLGLASPAARASAGNERLDQAMDRYARGDDAAFAELYRHASPRLRGFLVRLCGDRALADDLAQDAFLRIHRARGSFEPGAAALPWIFAIARNVFVDHARNAHVRRNARDVREGALPPEREAPPDTLGDEALIGTETLDIVRTTLGQLPVLQREAFILIRFEGMSVSDAAAVLGATEGAVKIRAFRAYEALREALGQDKSRKSGQAP